MKYPAVFLLGAAALAQAGSPDYFVPTNQVSGIGLARNDITDELLETRTDRMIQSQTFAIMRDPQALPGARRITKDAKLQSLFRSAAKSSGFPAPLLEAIAYLESWGDARAESPTGPRGIMQISEATARAMGLRIVRSRRYRTVRERVRVASKSRKARYRTISRRLYYTVVTRDDRLIPARAIPAAARYLAGMTEKFGGTDWAIFAYHCGQGCASEIQELARSARGVPEGPGTVARMFFSSSPVWNRDLYEAIRQQMERDWSPTYWFRVMRARELLALYREDPKEFSTLATAFKSDFGGPRAPHRLSVWLRRGDLVYRDPDDIRAGIDGKTLVKAFDRPERFGYTLRIAADGPSDRELFSMASPAAIGALTYVAFETRRLYEATFPNRDFRPLPVVSLVESEDYARQSEKREALAHCSGQVFDIDFSDLPPAEVECLRFVLDDLGWDGYLGFVDEGSDTLHIGCAPTAQSFFTTVFEEASGYPATE